MKNYDKNTEYNSIACSSAELSYLRCKQFMRMSKVPKITCKRLSKFDESFIKKYENSNKGYFLEVDAEYPKKLFNLHSELPFLLERNKIEKCNKLVCNVHDKENYFVHIRALK